METSPSNPTVIEAIGVDVVSPHRQRVLIAAVDWKVLAGEYWVIGGAHGSGKSDLLMTAAGLRSPGQGAIQMFGREFAELSEPDMIAQRRRIGFVFKGGGRMFTDLTVAENVALAVCYHRNWSAEQAQPEVHAVLELTGLTHLAKEPAQRLGVEWQQRVGLARALALKPEVLFLDEPAAGLEAQHRQWWRDFLAKLSEQKITLIAATNDFALWHGGQHRYARIKENRFYALDQNEGHPQLE